VLRMLIKYVIFWIGWLEIRMNSRLVVLILTSHPLASLPLPLLCVQFATIVIKRTLLVLIIFLMKGLLDLVV